MLPKLLALAASELCTGMDGMVAVEDVDVTELDGIGAGVGGGAGIDGGGPNGGCGFDMV